MITSAVLIALASVADRVTEVVISDVPLEVTAALPVVQPALPPTVCLAFAGGGRVAAAPVPWRGR